MMDNPMWERILIDWVNCLKLSKPIHKVTDLRDGIFFANLQKVLKKSSEIEFDVLTCLFHILNQHYPCFDINDRSNIHLSDLSHDDIAAVTSLLMHYTCIHDRRDVLTSPLCHNLQPVTQMGIKTFLEKVQECQKLTSEELGKITSKCLEDMNDKNNSQSQNWLSVAQSPGNLKQSPLLDILKTPASKGSRLQEKDREIARLITELELTQEEKENLEEDVRLQVEKNLKLEKQLKQKNIEISRLRSEVIALENRTPPHYQDKDFREAQKILRTKIEALEQIIEQCDKENEQLRNERDAERVQVKSLDSQCKTWLEKFIETDNKLQSLAQHSEEYEIKYENLQAHCSELEALLDELKPKNHSDSFIEESFQGVNTNRRSRNLESLFSCEDLAHSVVDVQLKDMQKENENLRLSLEDMNNTSVQLKQIVEQLTAEKNNISEELKRKTLEVQQLSMKNEKLLVENREEAMKYESLVHEKSLISEKYDDCISRLEEMHRDNENLNASILQLKEDVENNIIERNNILEYKIKIEDELKVVTETVQQLYADNQRLLSECQDETKKYASLLQEKVQLSDEYNRSAIQLEDMQKQNKILEINLEDMDKRFKQLKENSEILVDERNNILEGKNKLAEELTELTSKYEDSLRKYESMIEVKIKMSEEYDSCFSQLTETQKVNENLKSSLEELRNNFRQSTEIIKELTIERNGIMEDKNKIDDELRKTTQKLNQLSVDNSELLTKYQDIVNKYEALVEKNIQISDEYSKCVSILKNTQNELENIKSRLYDMDNSFRQLSESHEKLANERNCILEDKNKLSSEMKMTCEKLTMANEKLIADYQNEVMKYESLVRQKKELSEEYDVCIVKLKDMQIEIENLKKVIEENTVSKNSILEENHKLIEEVIIITKELQQLKIDYGTLLDENKELSKLVVIENNKNQALTEEKTDINRLLELEKLAKLEVSENLIKLKNDVDIATSKIEILSQNVEILNLEKKKAIEELQNLRNILTNISSEKSNLAIQLSDVINEKGSLCHKLEIVDGKNKDFIAKLNNCIKEKAGISDSLAKVSSEKYEIMEKLKMAELELEKLVKEKNQLFEQKKSIEQEHNSIKLVFERIELENNHYVEENQKFCEQLDLKSCQMKELQDMFENIVVENEKSTEMLNKYIEEKNELSNSLSECSLMKKSLSEKLDTLTQEKLELCNLLNEMETEKLCLSQELDAIKLGLEKSKITISSLTEERDNIIHEKSSIEYILHKTTSEKENLLFKISELSEDYNKISTDFKCIETERNDLYGKLELVVKEKDSINEYSDIKIRDLENSKQKLSDQLDEFSSENDNLKMNLKALESKVVNLESENNELLEEKSKISKELENLSTKFEDLIKEKGLVNKELSKLFSQLDNIMIEKNKMSADLVQTKNDNLSTVEQLTQLSKEYQGIQLENEKLRKKLEVLIAEIEEKSHALQLISGQTELLQVENVQTTQKLNRFLDIIESETGRIYNMFEKLQVFENANISESYSRTRGEADEHDYSIRIDNISENLITFLRKLEYLPGKLSEKYKLVSEDLKIYCERSECLTTELDEKNKIIERINCELNKSLESTEMLKKENRDLSQKVIDLKLIIDKLEIENNEISDNITKVTKEKNVISNFLDLNNNELQKVIQEREDILEALEMSNKEVENMSEQKNKLQVQNSEILVLLDANRSEMETLNKQRNELSQQVADLRKEIGDIKIELDSVLTENNKLLEQLKVVSQVKANFSEELDKVSQEKADISEELQNLKKKQFENSEYIKDLLVKNKQLTEENTQLLGKITSVSNDLDEKTKTVQLLELSHKQLKTIVDEKSDILEKVSEENKGIFDIVDKLSQEKLEMSDTLNQLSEEKMNMTETINKLTKELECLSEEKLKLSESLEMGHKELQKVKRERNEILKSQTTIMKETESSILLAHQSSLEVKNELLKKIEILENDKEKQKIYFDSELKKVREAYVNVVTTNSKLELEIVNLRKKIEERNTKLSEFSQVKEAFEKLLEENSKLMTEVDTLKYKRARDREEFVNLLKKEREEADHRESKRIKDVRNDYEGKVEKMKEKMLKLYREEINKEIQKVKFGQSETDDLQEIMRDLRSELFEAEQKIHMLETERDMLRLRESASRTNIHTSRESVQSLKEKDNPRGSMRSSITSLQSTDIRSRPNSEQMVRKVKSISTMHPSGRERESFINDKRTKTSTRTNGTEIEETITFSRRTSINGVPTNITPSMEMEDEDDDFNNKFLADMKAGRCIVGTTSNDGRLSELAWRNSLVPPHLKSSYPAETQVFSPTHFKEDDLKSGNAELDDSLCKLLPGEKPRQKKDFGTTAYKKPGPPTPSKNGGRLSLQGNEVLPLRDHNDRSPKKSITPSRIKALFMGRTNSRENSENQCTTPKTNNKRMSIFRKQR